MERLSTGKRINSAKDDAAGVAIASRLSSEIRGTNQAIRNASDGQALINTAEGAHKEVENILQRMRELAVQAANDTNDGTDRSNLQAEMTQLTTEIDRIAATTTWAGQNLLNGASPSALNISTSHNDKATFSFHVGAGTSARDAVSIDIGSVSAAALGVGGATSPEISATNVRSSAADRPASISVDGGNVNVSGKLENGDQFKFDVLGTEIAVTFSNSDQYTDDLDGLSAQMKAAVETAINDAATNPQLQGVSVVDNGNGSISLSQASTPILDEATITTGNTNTDTIEILDGNTIEFSSFEDADVFSVKINGVAVTLTNDATDTYTDDAAGMSAQLKDVIDANATLKGISVVDNGDGSVTLSQSTTPLIEAAEATPATEADATLSYDDTDTLTIGGSFVDGKRYSAEIFGKEVSFVASSNDGFADTTEGLAEQLAQAINDAGIAGITAAKNSGASTVTLTAAAELANGLVTKDVGTADAEIALDQAAGTITVSGAVDNGDQFSFDVNGKTISITVGADGFANDLDGISTQLKAAIDAANLTGVSVSDNGGGAVTLTMPLTTVTNTKSTVVTNVQVEETPNSTLTANGGKLTVGGEVASGDTFSVNVGGTAISITAGADGFEASTSGVSAQLAAAVNGAGIAGVSAKDNGDGTLDLSTAAISVNTAEGATDAITAIDSAIQTLNSQRANLGAVSNRLDNTINNLSNVTINLEGGKGRIEDADFAAESTALAKSQILQQASTAMLAQANASKQNVLSLLQG